MNEVVTNNLPRQVAAQVYLEDIDFTSQPGEISQPYSKFHKLLFRWGPNNDKYFLKFNSAAVYVWLQSAS